MLFKDLLILLRRKCYPNWFAVKEEKRKKKKMKQIPFYMKVQEYWLNRCSKGKFPDRF